MDPAIVISEAFNIPGDGIWKEGGSAAVLSLMLCLPPLTLSLPPLSSKPNALKVAASSLSPLLPYEQGCERSQQPEPGREGADQLDSAPPQIPLAACLPLLHPSHDHACDVRASVERIEVT